MGNYKIFDGQNWLDPCYHDIYFKDRQLGWQLLDPKVRDLRYHDGTYTAGWPTWKPMTCICTCPEGSTSNALTGACEVLQSPLFPGVPQIIKKALTETSYNKLGIKLFKSLGDLTTPAFVLPLTYVGSVVKDSASVAIPILSTTQSDLWGRDFPSGNSGNLALGRLNNAGVWNRTDTSKVVAGEEFGFNVCFNIGTAKEYICAIAGDNYVKLEVALNTIGGVGPFITIFDGFTAPADTLCFYHLHAFPITLPAGNHVIKLTGKNATTQATSKASVVAEIYDIPLATFQSTLLSATNIEANLNPYIYFSSKNLIGISTAPPGTLPSEYTCANGELDVCGGVPVCRIAVDCIENGGVPVPGVPSTEVQFEIQADYIVLTYKFLKDPTDTWPDGNGGDIYLTPYTLGGVTKVVKDDVQGRDLDTHTRLYAGPDENNPLLDSHYYGYSARHHTNTGAAGGGVFPKYKRDGISNLNGYFKNGSIPLTQESVLLHSGDNTGTGAESILINVKEIRARFGLSGVNVGTNTATQISTFIESFAVEMRAWWHTSQQTPSRYPVGMTAKFYTNTVANPITAVNLSNFVFQVVGGVETILTTPPVIVCNNLNAGTPAGSYGSTMGGDLYYNGTGQESLTPKVSKRINVLEYNFVTGIGKFVNNNGTLNTPATSTSSASPQKPLSI